MKFDQSSEISDDEAKSIIRAIVANGKLILRRHAKKNEWQKRSFHPSVNR
jgi:hypothetical protein